MRADQVSKYPDQKRWPISVCTVSLQLAAVQCASPEITSSNHSITSDMTHFLL